MNEEEIQKLLFQIESGKRQLEQLSKQAQVVELAIIESTSTIEALNTLKDQKPGTEILVQLGSGTYIKATLKDTNNVLVGIGSNISCGKKLSETVETIQSRKNKLTESFSAIQKTMGDLGVKLAELNAMAEKLIGQPPKP